MTWPTYYYLLFLHGDLRGQTDEEFVSQSYLNQHWWLDPPIITFCHYTVTYEARLMKSVFLRVIWINTDGLTHLLSPFVLTRWHPRPHWWRVVPQICLNQHWWLDPPIITILFLHGDLRGQTDEEFVPQSYLNQHWWLDLRIITFCSYTVTYEARVMNSLFLRVIWSIPMAWPTYYHLLFLHGDIRDHTDEELFLRFVWINTGDLTHLLSPFCSYTVTFEARLIKSLFFRVIWINTDDLTYLLLPFVPTRWPTRPDWWRVCSSDLSESTLMAWSTYYYLLFLHGDLRGQTDEEFVPQIYLNQHWWLDPPIITFCHYTVTYEARLMKSLFLRVIWINTDDLTHLLSPFCSYTVTFKARLMNSLFLRVIWINTDGLTHLLSLFALTWWPTRPDWWRVCSSELSESIPMA